MPVIQSLQKLAALKFVASESKLPHPVDEKVSNEILEALPDHSKINFISRNYENLNVRKIDFSGKVMFKKDIEMIRSFVLDSLILGDLLLVGRNKEHVNIVKVLRAALQKESRRTLRHLNIGTGLNTKTNWLEKVLELAPYLNSLSITKRATSFEPNFFKLSAKFGHLRRLDLIQTVIQSLCGISNFTNLEVLILRNSIIEETKSIEEIDELKKLTVLDVSRDENHQDDQLGLSHFLVRHSKSLTELKLFDCSNNNISDEEDLQSFLRIAPKLEKIVIFMNYDLYPPTLSGSVQFLDNIDLKSSIDLYKYFDSINRTEHLVMCLLDMTEFNFESTNVTILQECSDFLCKLLRDHSTSLDILHAVLTVWGSCCFAVKDVLDDRKKIELIIALLEANSRLKILSDVDLFNENIWFLICAMELNSAPGGPDLRWPLLEAIFEDKTISFNTMDLFVKLPHKEIFVDPRKYAFWITKLIDLLGYTDHLEWLQSFTECIFTLISNLLKDCKTEVDIRDVMRMISLLKELDDDEELSHEAAKIIKSMILLIHRKKLQPQDQRISLFNSVYRHFTKMNWTRLWSDRKSAESDILRYAIASMTDGEMEEVRLYLNWKICNYIATENSKIDRIIESEGNVTKNIEAPADTAKRKIEEILKDARALRVAIEVNGKGRRNLFGEPLETNHFKNQRVYDVIHNY